MLAFAIPVVRLVAPGPKVARQTPTFLVSLPYTSAINAADCSCRVIMNCIFDFNKDIIMSAFSSPGIPKMYSTPSASRHFTNRSDAFKI